VDPQQYFFNCLIYAPARQLLLASINLADRDIRAILHGDFNQELTTNEIHQFMGDTKRFNYGR